MNAFFRTLASGLACLTTSGLALPSIEMPNEWAAPLDSGKGMILVEKESGQARVIFFNGSFDIFESGPVITHLPGVTGLNTGLENGGDEYAIISSVTTNSTRFLNTNTLGQTTFQPEVPGPITAIPLRLNAGDPPAVHNLSRYGDASQVLRRYIDIFSGSPTPSGGTVSTLPVNDLQPSTIPGSPDQKAGVASIEVGGIVNLYEVRSTGGSASYSVIAGGGTAGEQLATQVIGDDGRRCIIRYRKGSTNTIIVTEGYNGFPVSSNLASVLPFPIGSIMAVPPGVPSAPHGVIITSEDGSSAIYAHINLGTTYLTQHTFIPQGGNAISGVVPVIGRGILVLEGDSGSRVSKVWRGFQNPGGGWTEVNGGSLNAWLPPQQNFATLFWFNGTPLVDPTAEIIKLETMADWTRKTAPVPIPALIELSNLLNPADGLIPSGTVATTTPTGATHLLTSQHEEQVSLTALDTNYAIQSPSVAIAPDSGDYTAAVTVTALFDPAANELFFREDVPGSAWTPFTTQTIGYPSSWLFYARNLSTGVAGPIIRRDFTFSTVSPNTLDTDRDGVPDYVERHLGLDPAGGPDSDGDFQSDLEEILAPTDPADSNSNTPPTATRTPPFLGEGFELIAQAYNGSNQAASPANDHTVATTEDDFPGETLFSYDLHGNLLAEENVVELTAPPSLAGNDGAYMAIGTPVPEDFWITLATPISFGVLDVLNPARTGREVLKVMQRPINPIASVVSVPTGTDRDADALAWIAAATAAHGSHEVVTSITELRPVDNAVSALAEQAIYDSLLTLPSGTQTALGVPASINDFTIFPQRNGETSRTGFTAEMFAALRNAGCNFPALMTLLETASADATVNALANSISNTHASSSAANPLMALPLDAFRSIIQTGGIVDPAPGDTARPDPYAGLSGSAITSAKATFDSILGQVAGTKRPVATWFLVIGPSTTPLHQYDYIRQGTTDKVFLMDRFGDRQLLEQGLGLAQGAVFEITGFTDVTPPAGFIGMEFISIDSVVTPLASDTDTNGNLLDDGWENVFFGDLGVVGPFDPHPISGHSYLQYHLTGADPRSGSLTDPIVFLMPTNIYLEWIPAATAYDLHFQFPAEFIDDFDFVLESSEDLTGFNGPANNGALVTVSPGNYRWRLEISESNLDANFFRIGVSLAAP